MSNSVVEFFLDGLMRRYQQRVPDVGRVIEKMIAARIISNASEIENDHIAFRTLGVPHLGIASLEKIFLHHGFEKRDSYDFAKKKLNAFWYSPPTDLLPRVFISELRVDDLSQASQDIVRKYTDQVDSDPVDHIDLNDGRAIDTFLHQPLWSTPNWAEYAQLQTESEYAGWAIYNRYYLNHFTVSIHNLPEPWNSIDKFNQFLIDSGFHLNDSGGEIKQSADGLLLQSSTVAEMVSAEFPDSAGSVITKEISGSYVEFAERRVLPEFRNLPANEIRREHRREGFEADNADKIFESTYSHQTR